MHSKVVEGLTNSVDPDQTAPRSLQSTQFAHALSVSKLQIILVTYNGATSRENLSSGFANR